MLGIQLLNYSSIIRWYEVLQNLGGTGGLHALGAKVVLDSARDTLQKGNLLTSSNPLINGLGLGQSLLTGNGQISLYITFYLVNAIQNSLGQLQGGYFFIYQHVVEDMGRLFKQIHGSTS